MGNNTKTILRIMGYFERLIELLLLVVFLNSINVEGQPLNGKHLLVLSVEVTPFLLAHRNVTGHIEKYTGNAVLALEWISNRLNFSYTILDDQVSSMENTPTKKGATGFLKEGKADLVWASIAMTSSRYGQMDYPYTFMISPFGLLIPMPHSFTDFRSIWEPFQLCVWMYLLLSLMVIVVYIYMVHPTKCFLQGNDSLNHRRARMAKYTIVVLMSQGGVYPSNRTSIRILFGTWCLALLVLGKAYSSVLVSFITLPIYQPLLNSVTDIPKTSGVRVTVEKDKGVDVYFRESETGINKFIGDMLREDPRLRCVKLSDCLDRVRKTGSDVYVNRIEVLLDLMGRDYKKMNRCDFAVAKEKFSNYQSSMFAMVKNGPYTRTFNKEFMNAESVGLFQIWWKKTTADPTQCLNKNHDQKVKVPTLTLGHLSGAFVVLGVGYALSFLAFIFELIYQLCWIDNSVK